jgi:Cytochrome c554 and c-prime
MYIQKFIVILFVLFLFVAVYSEEMCITCHDGIEKISENEEMADLSCTDCHKGDGNAKDQDTAHTGMYVNPSDLRVVDEICGDCHDEVINNVTKSLHATMAGMISGTRYAWGLQDRSAKYGTYAVSDDDPRGDFAVSELKQLPLYDPTKPEGSDNSPADDYLRNQCLRCHLWSDGHQRDGDWRASGCAACHMVYSDKGLYEGKDKAIPKDQKGRPRFHRMTNKIPEYQCIHCHNRGGRTGVSFIGTMESDGYGTPWNDKGKKQGKLHGKNYNHLSADVHYDKGMSCIDCHTMQDHHGNGSIYAKREQGVEIECEDCHGSLSEKSKLTTSLGNPLTNLRNENDQIILTSKLTGKDHIVPQLKDINTNSKAYNAKVSIPSHMEKMECYACHSRWAPQCYGCHVKQDIGKTSGDWINNQVTADPSVAGRKENRENSAFSWSESRSYLRWETPVLGINTEGKVSPFITGCQVIFSQFEGDKKLVNNMIHSTVDNTSGFAHNPIQPHTVSKESRDCVDCHMSRKAVGLGTGIYNSRANGLDIDFEMEQIVDENGKQLQSSAHEGSRPFNKEELDKIMRVGTCVACHDADDKLWKKVNDKIGINSAPTDDIHKTAIRKLIDN